MTARKGGRERRRLLVELCPDGPQPIVDVGADHGHVAHALSAIATERAPGRVGRSDVPWVVADGIAPFRRVGVAVIAGMGALTIAGILERGPRPDVVVLHAQDDPPRLRRWLAANGWRIEVERLAWEGHRYAEVLRAVRGEETASGLVLDYGPRLYEVGDPLLAEHLDNRIAHLQSILSATKGRAEAVAADVHERVTFLRSWRGSC